MITPFSIDSLQFQYVNPCGEYVLSQRHGTRSGSKFNVVKLNITTEYITGLKGLFDPVNAIISLTFITNKGKFGPFGFNSNTDGDGFAASGTGYGCSKLEAHF
ncbi:hypothetical protein HRI_004898600 [Hibiscus trionum]|uniref:Jacalin-type lectin domain-containing protein n=1 Tax=Hibiscus trionum TaxID=183268 RepID=A0A9W7MRL6_HIBTR|nr:hypothetical protein HRI_004898600 [Hibiscus trionum]